MIKVYFAHTSILTENAGERLIASLSDIDLSRYNALKRREDKQLKLLGLLLLSRALTDNCLDSFKLSDMKYNSYGRPFFRESSFDFNISHSGEFAAVAFTREGKVGVDIEVKTQPELSDFEGVFPPSVYKEIASSDDKNELFYRYWTMLESAIKADGRGLWLIDSKVVQIENGNIVINGKTWFSSQLNINPLISCNISSERENKTTEVLILNSV